MRQEGKQQQNTNARKHTLTVATSSIIQPDAKEDCGYQFTENIDINLLLFSYFYSGLLYTSLTEEV